MSTRRDIEGRAWGCRIGKITPKSNVVPIWHGISHEIPGTPPDVLELVHRIVARAERGELRGLAITAITTGNSVWWGLEDGAASPIDMIGAAALLWSRLVHKFETEAELRDPYIGDYPEGA